MSRLPIVSPLSHPRLNPIACSIPVLLVQITPLSHVQCPPSLLLTSMTAVGYSETCRARFPRYLLVLHRLNPIARPRYWVLLSLDVRGLFTDNALVPRLVSFLFSFPRSGRWPFTKLLCKLGLFVSKNESENSRCSQSACELSFSNVERGGYCILPKENRASRPTLKSTQHFDENIKHDLQPSAYSNPCG